MRGGYTHANSISNSIYMRGLAKAIPVTSWAPVLRASQLASCWGPQGQPASQLAGPAGRGLARQLACQPDMPAGPASPAGRPVWPAGQQAGWAASPGPSVGPPGTLGSPGDPWRTPGYPRENQRFLGGSSEVLGGSPRRFTEASRAKVGLHHKGQAAKDIIKQSKQEVFKTCIKTTKTGVKQCQCHENSTPKLGCPPASPHFLVSGRFFVILGVCYALVLIVFTELPDCFIVFGRWS